jgi:hypothetical protein
MAHLLYSCISLLYTIIHPPTFYADLPNLAPRPPPSFGAAESSEEEGPPITAGGTFRCSTRSVASDVAMVSNLFRSFWASPKPHWVDDREADCCRMCAEAWARSQASPWPPGPPPTLGALAEKAREIGAPPPPVRGFTFFRRRHHCRCCGSVVCGAHSSRSLPMLQWGVPSAERCCDECHAFNAEGLDALLVGECWVKPGDAERRLGRHVGQLVSAVKSDGPRLGSNRAVAAPPLRCSASLLPRLTAWQAATAGCSSRTTCARSRGWSVTRMARPCRARVPASSTSSKCVTRLGLT